MCTGADCAISANLSSADLRLDLEALGLDLGEQPPHVGRIHDSGAEVLAGVYGYAFQLYYDFSGYTDIAMGSALLLGITLTRNFNRPYAAQNISDFWRRWHISFSNWLRDYLYFSLPGLRSRWKIFAYLNLVVTMVIGGLWHGAGWTFLVWGAWHGVGLAAHRTPTWPPAGQRRRSGGGVYADRPGGRCAG